MEYLGEEQVRGLLTYEALIPAVERALIDLSAGRIQQPLRSILRVAEHEGIFALMPAVDGELMSVKLVTIYEGNGLRGDGRGGVASLPTHQAVIQLFSAKTGEPLVAMDGRLITEMRTAAVSAAAVRLLAREDARVLAILGSGVQARSHLRALREVRRFDEVRVWSRTEEHARRFAHEFETQVARSLEDAMRGADVVISAASTREPLVRGAWLEGGTLVCAVGAVGPERRELDDAAMQGTVVVESRAAAARESGDVMGSGAAVEAELGELLAGTRNIAVREKWVVFKSLGVAATDLAAARLVWHRWGSVPRKS